MIILEEKSPEDKFRHWRNISYANAINPDFRAHVYELARAAGVSDMRTQSPALIAKLAERLVYAPEPFEFYHWPNNFRRAPIGDCDDFALYVASVLTVSGVPHRFVIVFNPETRSLEHVYVRAFVSKETYNFDPTMPEKPLRMNPIDWLESQNSR